MIYSDSYGIRVIRQGASTKHFVPLALIMLSRISLSAIKEVMGDNFESNESIRNRKFPDEDHFFQINLNKVLIRSAD